MAFYGKYVLGMMCLFHFRHPLRSRRKNVLRGASPSVRSWRSLNNYTFFRGFREILHRSSFQISSKPENLLSDSHALLERRKCFCLFLHQGFTNTGWLNFVLFSLRLLRPECETCFMSPYGAWNFEGAPWYVENLWKTAVHISWPIWVKSHIGNVRIIPLTCFMLVGAGRDILLFSDVNEILPYFLRFHSVWKKNAQ
jgi:hypothetical protein